jgi:hypothetical protein
MSIRKILTTVLLIAVFLSSGCVAYVPHGSYGRYYDDAPSGYHGQTHSFSYHGSFRDGGRHRGFGDGDERKDGRYRGHQGW